MAKIKCNKDLFNDGKCFTKGKIYETNISLKDNSSIINAVVVNDLGERHHIGMWYKHFNKI